MTFRLESSNEGVGDKILNGVKGLENKLSVGIEDISTYINRVIHGPCPEENAKYEQWVQGRHIMTPEEMMGDYNPHYNEE
jgi:hypothetical protein